MKDRPDHSQLSDQDLLMRYRQTQDNVWLGELLQRYTLLLYGVSMKYLKNEEDAKDSVQQVFEKVMTEINKYEISYFKSWLFMVVKNHCLMKLRNAGQTVSIPEFGAEQLPHPGDEKDHHIEKEKRLNYLEEAMQELNKEQNECITLFFLQKLSYQQISVQTGYSIMQVKSHIQNGKRNLKLLLERRMKNER